MPEKESNKTERKPSNWELDLAIEYFVCVKKAIELVEERKLIGWNTGELINDFADMFFKDAYSEDNIKKIINHVRQGLHDYDDYCI